METLLDTIYDYAMEQRMDTCPNPVQTDLEEMRDRALSDLKAMGERAADCAGRLEYCGDALCCHHRRAGFLAGLELGRV